MAQLIIAGDLTPSQALTGHKFSAGTLYNADGTMANQGALTYTPSGSVQSTTAGYHSSISVGAVTVPTNDVRSGTVIAGQTGTMDLTNKTAGNIKQGVVIDGTIGTFTNDATAGASDIATGKMAYVNGNAVNGTAKGQATGTATATAGGVLTISGLLFTPTQMICSDQSNGYRATYDVAGGANTYAVQSSGSVSACTFSTGVGTFTVQCNQFISHSIKWTATEI